LIGLLLNPQDGGDMFLWCIGLFQTTQCYSLEDHIFHSHQCENFRSDSKCVFVNNNNIFWNWNVFKDPVEYSKQPEILTTFGCMASTYLQQKW
jgi:hypothetical protein